MRKATEKFKPGKIYRKYEDFYDANDLKDPDTLPIINLSIDDFDARGRVVNPRAPCLVTTIDPDYIKDARTQRLARKFRMKTDILLLRDITRKKFMMYATQQMHLDKQRETAQQEQVYCELVEFCDFTENSLKTIESNAFKEMMASQEELKALMDVKLVDELKALREEHHRVLVEVDQVYQRFLHLLRLIGYFDDIGGEDEGRKIVLPTQIAEFRTHSNSEDGIKQMTLVKQYMYTTVRPYLDKRNYINAEIWLKGYELIRSKIFNYYRRYTRLALLNHIVALVYEKFQKTHKRCELPPTLRDPKFMKSRMAALQMHADKALTIYEEKQKEDKVSLKLNAIVPIILKSLQSSYLNQKEEDFPEEDQQYTIRSLKSRTESGLSSYRDDSNSILSKVEAIQSHLLWLLNQLDDIPVEQSRQIEKLVRRRILTEKEKSRRALVEQTRLQNWMKHFKKHEMERQHYRRYANINLRRSKQ